MRLRWQHSKIQKTVVISVLLSTTDKYTDAQYQTIHAPNTDKTKIPTDKCTVSTLQQLEDNRNLPTQFCNNQDNRNVERNSATISQIRLYFSGPHLIRRTKTRLAANNLLLPYNNRPQVQCPEQCVHITNTTLLYNGSIIPVRAQINSSKVQVTSKNMVCATVKLLPLRHPKKKVA